MVHYLRTDYNISAFFKKFLKGIMNVKNNKFKTYLLIMILVITMCLFTLHIVTIQYLHTKSLKAVPKKFINRKVVKINSKPQSSNKLLTIKCYEQSLEPRIEQHGNFWVFYNYVTAENRYNCNESVTFTTQGDYSFLDNIVPIVKRWRGPVSVALHAPGTDFAPTLNSIAYLRECETNLIMEYVTFHLVIDSEHLPKTQSSGAPVSMLYKDGFNCTKGAPYAHTIYKHLYKTKHNMSYPINVARNVAKQASQTHFVLAADIELYPSVNLIKNFFQMIKRRNTLIEQKKLLVFALPVFEVLANSPPPQNKIVLRKMFNGKKAFSFHQNICKRCHAIPNLKQWIDLNDTNEMDIFSTLKRRGTQVRWEAVYIGTRDDPAFDERLDWEQHGNKMAQAYILCILDYDYLVLNNAFLVHKPGIKKKMVNAKVIPETAKYIRTVLRKDLDLFYGTRKGCIA